MATHYVARELAALGHDVKQVPPAYAKPFRQRHKNDFPLEDNPSPLLMQRKPNRLSISPVVEAPQMKKIAANIKKRQFPAATPSHLAWTTTGLSRGPLPLWGWRMATSAKAASRVTAALAFKTERQPNKSTVLDANRRPAAEPRNCIVVPQQWLE
jgi:hypothetical protein